MFTDRGTRPYFGKTQITGQAQIHKNKPVRVRDVDEHEVKGTIIRGPFKIDGIIYVTIEFRKRLDRWIKDIPLHDLSVIREGNLWHDDVWLEWD